MKECPDKPNRNWHYPCWGMENFYVINPWKTTINMVFIYLDIMV